MHAIELNLVKGISAPTPRVFLWACIRNIVRKIQQAHCNIFPFEIWIESEEIFQYWTLSISSDVSSELGAWSIRGSKAVSETRLIFCCVLFCCDRRFVLAHYSPLDCLVLTGCSIACMISGVITWRYNFTTSSQPDAIRLISYGSLKCPFDVHLWLCQALPWLHVVTCSHIMCSVATYNYILWDNTFR